ncbi:MAG: hypothetical protein P8Y43_09335 [Sulfurovaceae bacterium]
MTKSKKVIFLSILSIIIFLTILFLKSYGSNIIQITNVIQEFYNAKGSQKCIIDDPKIGKKINFVQPICFIVRKQPSIVPIVAKIEKELSHLHSKLGSEAFNQYIPSTTSFTITNVCSYEDVINYKNYIYVLSDEKNIKYTIGEDTYKRLLKPAYETIEVPLVVLDDLFKNNNFAKMRFYSTKGYRSKLTKEYFSNCGVQDFSKVKWGKDVTATVNFKQLKCLYDYFWNDFHSERLPIAFEIQ